MATIATLDDLLGLVKRENGTENKAMSAGAAYCSVCGEPIPEKVATFSMNRYKRWLCMEHQNTEQKAESKNTNAGKCTLCGGPVSEAEAAFCSKNPKFVGKIYCRNCQSKAGKESVKPAGQEKQTYICDRCKTPINAGMEEVVQLRSQYRGKLYCAKCREDYRIAFEKHKAEKRKLQEGIANKVKCEHCGNEFVLEKDAEEPLKAKFRGKLYCPDCQIEYLAAMAKHKSERAKAMPEAAEVQTRTDVQPAQETVNERLQKELESGKPAGIWENKDLDMILDNKFPYDI